MMQSFNRVRKLTAPLALAFCAPQLALAQSTLEKKTVVYRKIDGHEILADVYLPKDKGNSDRPLIVYLHGGGLMGGNRQNIELYPKTASFSTLKFAEEHGYAVVSIDYRLAPETKLPNIIGDIEAAFAWLGSEGAKKFHLDTGRMVVIGGSAGGYLTLATGYRVHPKPKALVALYGMASSTQIGMPNQIRTPSTI